ncbi:condensation domain-containing protein [Myxococcus sp. K38C18041901]|uniref:condensation domain-containing protein n=1 Tax=Myxococcus guangdongensis TaxID=2906760 RepID=UPI0020A7407A|nr:condensation domain-containing protein [Myxococcus guangdongensis]MCP3063638.1 condensation domain-containing protein [Myxococcus guangdongensis]
MTTAFPMSFAQQRLCFLHRMDPTGAAHATVRCHRVTGPLDSRALREALDVLVARHEPLRTVFPLGTQQQVSEAGHAHVRVLEVATEAEALRLAYEEAARPFDLEQGPLLRLTVMQLTPRTHFLVLAVHLLAADGTSLQVFTEELALAYRAALAGQSAVLPELPVQYVDWAAWQREQLTAERRESLSRWWREQLSGVPLFLDLVPPRPVLGRGRRMHRVLPAGVAEGVRALASAERQTVFTVLAAACGRVLGHRAGREQVLLGLAVANRDLPEVERVLGFFVDTVVLQVDLRGDVDLRALLTRVASATAAAYAHKDLPFEQLVADLRPPRDPTRSPVVQVNFAYHPVGTAGALALHDCEVTELLLDLPSAKFELTVRVEERSDGAFTVWAEYDESLFDSVFIEGLLAAHEEVLRAATPDARASLPRSPPEGRERHLSRIFADVLRVASVAPDDDFFLRGGHSLQLVEVAVRIRNEMGQDLSLRELYQHPTVAGIAARLDRTGAP